MAGRQFGMKRFDLIKLVVGSLLHDIGKTEIPQKILNKPQELTKQELIEIKKHSVLGYKLLINSKVKKKIDPCSANIVLNHHERINGSGYPRGLKGNDLSDMDMLCGIADVYNAMTTNRVYRKAVPHNEVYEMLMGSAGINFSYKVICSFLKCITPYPEGSLVKLNNGQKACVIKNNSSMPFSPVVCIISTSEELDLGNELNITISSLLSSEEIQKAAAG
jgi:HD-GYP domain-containing protein (c-di-GMP phosphodiesterase class II)